MSRIRRVLPFVVTAFLAFVLGAAGGFLGGMKIASDIWARLSRPSMVGSGSQALNVIQLLDSGENARLRDYLESEIDSTLTFIESIDATGGLNEDEITRGVFDRLARYRNEHPRDSNTDRQTTTESEDPNKRQ